MEILVAVSDGSNRGAASVPIGCVQIGRALSPVSQGGSGLGAHFRRGSSKGNGRVQKKKEKEKERNVKKQQMKGSPGRKTGTGRSRYFLLCARLSASQEGSLVSLFPSLILSVFSCAQRAGDANLAAALASFKYSYGLFILRASRMSHLSNIFFSTYLT